MIYNTHHPESKNKNRSRFTSHLENHLLFDHYVRKNLNLNDLSPSQPEEHGPENKDAWKQFVLFSLALVVTPLLML